MRSPRGPARARRPGQAAVETAITLGVFLAALALVLDTCWLVFHHLAANHAVRHVARAAALNRLDPAALEDHFFDATGGTMLARDNPDLTVSVSYTASDPTFATAEDAARPSVTVRLRYRHRFLGPWPVPRGWREVQAVARSMVTTWAGADEPGNADFAFSGS